MLVDNYAGIAGGAVFATDMASFSMTCFNELLLDDVAGCPSPAWSNNTVSGLPSVMGYVLIAAAAILNHCHCQCCLRSACI